jgi:glycosyltransferase involved in cell wall biosynthesis
MQNFTKISIIIPVYNEEHNILVLTKSIIASLEKLRVTFEVIFINDGSVDNTEKFLLEASEYDHRIKVVNLRRNYGQTAAMCAGIDLASGDIIIPMDGDLQNDPDDIPLLLSELDNGYDVVSGWRKQRKDANLRRNLPSRVANCLISRVSGVRLHDYGCTLKAYRKDVIKDVRLYGEMHRFIPIYASWQGARISEVVVQHHPRIHGNSKYGLERTIKVFLDLLMVKFLDSHFTKPIYVFGGTGIGFILLSFLVVTVMIARKLVWGVPMIITPLPILAAMAFVTGVVNILMGIMAEMLMRMYFELQGKTIYLVRNTINFEAQT